MQLNMSAIVFVFLLFFSGLWQEVAVAASTIEERKISENDFLLNVKSESGLYFKDIPMRKLRLGGYWILQLKSEAGMRIELEDGQLLPARTITAENFTELITMLFDSFQERGIYPAYIQVELGLVDEYKHLAVSVIRQAQCNIEYAVNKEPCLSKALLSAFRKAELTQQTCMLIEQRGGRCSEQRVDMDSIAFTSEFFGKPWGEVSKSSNAGMSISTMWFSININN